jgi:hypothetical protein
MGRLFDAVTFGPARRRRSMDKQLARLDAAYRLGTPSSPRDWQPYEPSSGAGASASLGRLVVVLVLIGAAVAGVVVLLGGVGNDAGSPRVLPTARGSISVDGGPGAARDSSLPPPGVGSAPDRLRPVVTGPAGSGGYAFAGVPAADGSPVTYDPCRPIRYVVRPDNAPANGLQLIQQAVSQVSDATGLEFAYEGPTTEGPGERQPYQPGRYGERWAPVLITWSDPQETRGLAGSTTGTGGSQSVTITSTGTGASESAYVTGSVVLDAPQLRRFTQQGGAAAVRAVIAHELGHVVGLAHVDDSSQLMYRESRPAVTRFQAGDLRGLARLGAGACHPSL